MMGSAKATTFLTIIAPPLRGHARDVCQKSAGSRGRVLAYRDVVAVLIYDRQIDMVSFL
jgi:hypothetical protein